MRISRSTAGTAFVGGAMILTLTALAYPTMLGVQTTSTTQDRVVANTNYGPLTEADRDFVVKVRAAGLWEHPLGLLAMERGTTPEMKEAGQHLVVGHGRLDASCRKISLELGITLPNQASPQQQGFVETVKATSGKEFDSTAVNIMRVTHGQIFPVIAKVRANTRNTLIRQLADQANDTVLDHITVLEKTGLVNQEQVNFQQTSPPKLPNEQVTPPAPQPGSPVLVLPIPKELEDLSTASPAPSPSGTVR
ncbi:DUF4142 domain-containing protein [Streptomyces cellulosae]|uniref:DUF4142 domain-containing protein n=1 Tax=Streptomyces cellulosae TaxID=1968 RepID=UPI00224D3E6E|nr:DUF4142 domain-containing protein [Streptomyces cellulosae]WTB92201.1 DUF4142 domain-containing protein [Streptomyces cellulosae]WTC59558.1 DUF4142 domain-containing protein [Streptomyces cellulosae]